MQTIIKASLIFAALSYFPLEAANKHTIDSLVVKAKEAHKTQYAGSAFYTYFQGDTWGTEQAITGVAIIEPDNEIHPAHKHAEEELLMIIEGSGKWELNGKSFPAETGDVLYAAPWDMHGIYNTGDVPLKFVIMKWHSKGLPLPKEQ